MTSAIPASPLSLCRALVLDLEDICQSSRARPPKREARPRASAGGRRLRWTGGGGGGVVGGANRTAPVLPSGRQRPWQIWWLSCQILLVQGCKNSNVFHNSGYNFLQTGVLFYIFLHPELMKASMYFSPISRNDESLDVFLPQFLDETMHLDVFLPQFLDETYASGCIFCHFSKKKTIFITFHFLYYIPGARFELRSRQVMYFIEKEGCG
jgi:hypothetical protein